MNDFEQLEKAIEVLDAQRAVLGDSVVDAAIAPLKARLDFLHQVQAGEQRKQLTVLFAEISNWSQFSQTLDAEDVSLIIQALWQRLDLIIEEHGGRIDKHIGSGVMALWGVDAAREDDPERAVHAGLALLAELSRFTRSLDKTIFELTDLSDQARALILEDAVQLQARLGIHTGPVLLGSVKTTGEFTAMGDTVNLASRLQNAASAGSILISQDTYQFIRGLFDVSIQPPLHVKGKVDAVQTFIVRRANPRSFQVPARGVEGIETQMVGRSSELSQLQTVFLSSLQGVASQVTILGDAGIGKSRLIFEFDKWLNDRREVLLYFKARAHATSQHQPYALLRDLFDFRLGILESDPVQVAREKLENGIGDIQAAHYIGSLLGIDFANSPFLIEAANDYKRFQKQALEYLAEYFRRLMHAVAKPETGRSYAVVMLLEDLHWADDRSLDALEWLCQEMAQLPLFILCAARPVLFDRRPNWGVQPQDAAWASLLLALNPLTGEDSRRLVTQILHRVEDLSTSLLDTIVQHAEGNPFYIEELVKVLVDDGVIVKTRDRWVIMNDHLIKLRIPTSLRAVLQARFDSLSNRERDILQRASVIGRYFWDSAVDALGQDGAGAAGGSAFQVTPETGQALNTLVQREMIFERATSAFGGTREYVFKHALLRDTTYESVLKRNRKIYHARAAQWLERISRRNGRVGEAVSLIAEHYDMAEEHSQAAGWFFQAGLLAGERFANAEAEHFLQRSLELYPKAAIAERFMILKEQERLFGLVGARSKQLHTLEIMVQMMPQMAPVQQAEVVLRQSLYADVTGAYQEAIRFAEKAIDLASQTDDRRVQARANLRLGSLHWKVAAYEQAVPYYQTALQLSRQEGDLSTEAESLRRLGIHQEYQGNHQAARQLLEQALTLKRQVGDLRGEAQSLNSLAGAAYYQGDFSGAEVYLKQGLLIKIKIGDRMSQETTLYNLGLTSFCRGRYVQAMEYLNQAHQMADEIQDREGEALILEAIGEAHMYSGKIDEAHIAFQNALEIFQEIGDPKGECSTLAFLGLLSLYRQQLPTAQEYARKALTLARNLETRRELMTAYQFAGHIALAQGLLDEAQQAYQQSIDMSHNQPDNLLYEALAGQARVDLRRDDLPAARSKVAAILETFWQPETGLLFPEGTVDPLSIFHTVYETLRLSRDPRAAAFLAHLGTLLNTQAEQFEDPSARQAFLQQVPGNQAVQAIFAADHQP